MLRHVCVTVCLRELSTLLAEKRRERDDSTKGTDVLGDGTNDDEVDKRQTTVDDRC